MPLYRRAIGCLGANAPLSIPDSCAAILNQYGAPESNWCSLYKEFRAQPRIISEKRTEEELFSEFLVNKGYSPNIVSQPIFTATVPPVKPPSPPSNTNKIIGTAIIILSDVSVIYGIVNLFRKKYVGHRVKYGASYIFGGLLGEALGLYIRNRK